MCVNTARRYIRMYSTYIPRRRCDLSQNEECGNINTSVSAIRIYHRVRFPYKRHHNYGTCNGKLRNGSAIKMQEAGESLEFWRKRRKKSTTATFGRRNVGELVSEMHRRYGIGFVVCIYCVARLFYIRRYVLCNDILRNCDSTVLHELQWAPKRV